MVMINDLFQPHLVSLFNSLYLVYTVPDSPVGHDMKLNSFKRNVALKFMIRLDNLITTSHRKSGKIKYDRKLTELDVVTTRIRHRVTRTKYRFQEAGTVLLLLMVTFWRHFGAVLSYFSLFSRYFRGWGKGWVSNQRVDETNKAELWSKLANSFAYFPFKIVYKCTSVVFF